MSFFVICIRFALIVQCYLSDLNEIEGMKVLKTYGALDKYFGSKELVGEDWENTKN